MPAHRVRIRDAHGDIAVVDLSFSQLSELLGDWKPQSREEKLRFWRGETSIDCKRGNIKLVMGSK